MAEILIDTAVYVAPCEQKNPVELYGNPAGYDWQCAAHGRPATFKVLFLSPKGEVEGFFGPRYFCGECVPDIHQVTVNQEKYLGVLYGGIHE
jgi:hypothetical protein